MRPLLLLLAVAFTTTLLRGGDTPKTKLLIAFASFKERPLHPRVYFYEHDGDKSGKIVGSIDPVNQRSDYHPSLSLDGKWCAFASELENQTSRISLWDVAEKKLATLPLINDSPNAQLHPSLSGDGKLVAFAAWDRPGSSQRWDVLLYDLTQKKMAETPELSTQPFDERMPAMSADGRWIAFVSNRKGGVGLNDVYLYDRIAKKTEAAAELNSAGSEMTPSLSGDGNLVAYVSDRPGGEGGRDIYVYDRSAKKHLPLPGVNSPGQEQTPVLSADGRFLVFVSERLAGEGERDVYLYDRTRKQMLPAPGLNSKKEDFDPCVIVVPPS